MTETTEGGGRTLTLDAVRDALPRVEWNDAPPAERRPLFSIPLQQAHLNRRHEIIETARQADAAGDKPEAAALRARVDEMLAAFTDWMTRARAWSDRMHAAQRRYEVLKREFEERLSAAGGGYVYREHADALRAQAGLNETVPADLLP